MDEKYIRRTIIFLLIFFIFFMSLTYYRVLNGTEKLSFKLEEFSGQINNTHDKLRLLFAKHSTEFIKISQYIIENYGDKYYIEYKNDNIFVDHRKRKHSCKTRKTGFAKKET